MHTAIRSLKLATFFAWPVSDVDDMIVSLYAGGMTIRDIQHHMATAMRVDISHETISAVTDAVLDEVMV